MGQILYPDNLVGRKITGWTVTHDLKGIILALDGKDYVVFTAHEFSDGWFPAVLGDEIPLSDWAVRLGLISEDRLRLLEE